MGRSSGWNKLMQQTTFYGSEPIETVVLNNEKTGAMGKYVQGGKQCKWAAEAAIAAARVAEDANVRAQSAFLEARTRVQLLSCSLKLHLKLQYARKRLFNARMEEMQRKVMEKVEAQGGVRFIEIDLIARQVSILKPVQFEKGKAVIKQESRSICKELAVALQAIDQTCDESSNCPTMHFRIEGHTAVSKRSPDHGISTSTARARAVSEEIEKNTENTLMDSMWPIGFGDTRPPKDPSADPRRVEVIVMTQQEALVATWQREAKSMRRQKEKNERAFEKYFYKWKKGKLSSCRNDYDEKLKRMLQ